MRRSVFSLVMVLCAVLLTPTGEVAAQATSGNIRGVVTDPTGAPMPGVTVVATSDALVSGQKSSVTGGNGNYRFPSLPVGAYVIEAHMPGFQSIQRDDIRISLGTDIELNLQLGDVTISQEIVVVADTVQVSTVDNSVSFNVGEDFIERQPLRRDPTDLMNYAPGIQNGQAYGAPDSYQNAYNMDGVDVSDPGFGSQWILPSMEWVQEVQVEGLGADAEYGGFTGAVVNLVTKSGGNTFHGDLRAYYSGGGLNSENAPEGAEGVETLDSDVDVSLSLGGPIIKDNLWYFVSGNWRQTTVDPFYSAGAPIDDRAQDERTWSRALGKLTWQINESNQLLGLVDVDDVVNEYRGIGEFTLASGAEKQESPNLAFNLSWESLINNYNFLNVKLTGYDGSDDRLPYNGDAPGREDFDSSFFWDNKISTEFKDVSRTAFDASWSLFADGLLTKNDSHNFKFGGAYEKLANDEQSTRNGGFSYYDDSYWCDSLDQYFEDPFCGVYSSDWGDEIFLFTEMEGLHFYAQDSWMTGRVTINVGVRYSNYVGNFDDPVSAPTSGGSDVYDVDMWSPRLGFVWDVTGSGKTVVKAHYGQYYEGMAVTFFDRELSGAAFTDWIYLDYDFDTGEFDIPVGGQPADQARMDPGIKHPYVEQIVATVEHQLGNDYLIGMDYIHRENQDISGMVTANTEDYDPLIAPDNPLTGDGLPFFDLLAEPDYLLTNPENAERTYDSVVLRMEKRYSGGWSLGGSLVWSDLTGNADYGFSGYVEESEDANGLVNAYGTLPFNSEWVFKVAGSVDLPWEILLSGFYQFRTGEYWTPYVRVNGLYFNDRSNVKMTDRGSEQYDDRQVLDLRLQKDFTFGTAMVFGIFVDAFNVLDSDKVTSVSQRWGDYDYDYEDHPEGSEWFERSGYKAPLSIQAPRTIRIGAKFSW